LRLDEVDLNAHADWLSWHCDPAAKRYAASLKARGKHGGIIACALAHRANRITHALVRDQNRLQPRPLGLTTPGLSSTAAQNAGALGVVNLERPEPAFCAGEDERR
jgi:hypothetical protein